MNIENATRPIFWNLSSPLNQVFLYIFFAISLIIFTYGMYSRLRLYLGGQPANLGGNFFTRTHQLITNALFQKRVIRDRKAGYFHTLIYLGFLSLLAATTAVFIEHDLGFKIFHGRLYIGLTLASDILGFLLLVGLLLAYKRRVIDKDSKLHLTSGDTFMLASLAILVVQGFFLEAIRIKATDDPWALYSPVGKILSLCFWAVPNELLIPAHFALWWIHALTFFAALAITPYTKFHHITASSLNLFFRDSSRPKGAAKYIGDIEQIIEKAEDELRLGVSTIKDISWKQRLDLDACTSCGRCQEVCPAYNSGKPLSPKWLVLDTRNHMLGLFADKKISSPLPALNSALESLDSKLIKGLLLETSKTPFRGANELVQNSAREIGIESDTALAGGVMDENVFWSCTTCRACVEACPVGIDHVDLILDVRRHQALIEAAIPNEAQQSLRALENRGNPFGPAEERINWASGLDVKVLNSGDEVDVLYWVGCVSAFDKRKQSIARSIVKILNHSGVNWGTLGNRECCSGDPARRLGEENLYQNLAKKNLATLDTIKFKRVLTNCPHCFNTLKNEYPQLGFNFNDIVHHSVFIKELVDTGKIKLSETVDNLTFHDPCYLGRYNDVYEEPREVLVQLTRSGKVEEMELNREKGFCCGAGGGHFWMDQKLGERVNVKRIEQALETGCSSVATGCPFCMQMLEDGAKLKSVEEKVQVRDIAELVADSL